MPPTTTISNTRVGVTLAMEATRAVTLAMVATRAAILAMAEIKEVIRDTRLFDVQSGSECRA